MFPRLEASDGCDLTDGEAGVVSTHGVVPFPMEFVLQHIENYNFEEKPDGIVCVTNKKHTTRDEKRAAKDLEATLPQHPNFGRPCHNGLCCMYAPYKCKTCFLKRFCSKQCELEHTAKHKFLCNTVIFVKNRPGGVLFLKGIFSVLNGACKRFYEIGNTARCCYTDVQRLSCLTQKELRKKLTRSQEVMFLRLGYSEKKSKRLAKQFVFSTYDVHWDWAARDARRILATILRFTGPSIQRMYG